MTQIQQVRRRRRHRHILHRQLSVEIYERNPIIEALTREFRMRCVTRVDIAAERSESMRRRERQKM